MTKEVIVYGAIRYFVVENYSLFTLLVGLLLMIRSDVFFDTRGKTVFKDCAFLLFALSVVDLVEHITARWSEPSKLRSIMCAMNYSIRPVIVLGLIFLIHDTIEKWLIIPEVINIVLCLTSIYTGWIFYFDSDNGKHIGALGFVPPLVGLFYLVVIVFISIRGFRINNQWERFIMIFLVMAGTGALAIGGIAGAQEIYNTCFAAVVVLYYLFCYSQVTRRDALTKLYNRQTFFSDAVNRLPLISGLISIDMNELKWINDHMGHADGDEAIKKVSSCFMKCVSADDKVYRLGGDEFVIICYGRGATEIKFLADRIRLELSKTPYSCAMGISMQRSGMDVDDMLTEADARMYEDKAEMKRLAAEKGRVLHTRESKKRM